MKETDLEKKLSLLLRKVGAVEFNVHGHVYQKKGWPDHYYAHPIWTGWVEFKKPRGKLSGPQKGVIRDLAKRGVAVLVVRFHDGFMTVDDTDVVIESKDGRTILQGFAAAEQELVKNGKVWAPNSAHL